MSPHTNRRHVPLRDRLLDRAGGWTTVWCPNPRCLVRLRFRHATAYNEQQYREVLARHGRCCKET